MHCFCRMRKIHRGISYRQSFHYSCTLTAYFRTSHCTPYFRTYVLGHGSTFVRSTPVLQRQMYGAFGFRRPLKTLVSPRRKIFPAAVPRTPYSRTSVRISVSHRAHDVKYCTGTVPLVPYKVEYCTVSISHDSAQPHFSNPTVPHLSPPPKPRLKSTHSFPSPAPEE